MIDRRRLLLTLLGGALAAPRHARAQQGARPATIGVLASVRLTEPVQAAIRDGLREQGYVEGRNIAIEWRVADGRPDRVDALAMELAHLKVEVIVAILSPAVQASKNATNTIPIVMAPAGDPVGSGFIVSLARPGYNVTGVTGIGAELSGKHLEALRRVVPSLRRVALLVNPAGGAFTTAMTAQTQAAANTSHIGLHVVQVRNGDDLERAFVTMTNHQDEAVVIQGPIFIPLFGRIAQMGLRHRLPSISTPKEFAEAGGLLAYGANQIEMTRRAMWYVARILQGTKPGALPVEQPTKFELVINLKTAKALGLTTPPSLLAMADHVIE